MGFGNPYGEEWNPEIVQKWSDILFTKLGVKILAVSDTIGSATPDQVKDLFSVLIPQLASVEFGAHIHTKPDGAKELVNAAYSAGCRRFDGAIKGFGGCPMAKDDLTGNMPTEIMLDWFNENEIITGIEPTLFKKAYLEANSVFPM
jgi:hydroxymethylglutaryl-CoA lyase